MKYNGHSYLINFYLILLFGRVVHLEEVESKYKGVLPLLHDGSP